MQGKRADGRSSTAAAASPNTAKTALEALLTCEGLEKDPDLEAEVAYITSRQNVPSTASAAGSASAQVGRIRCKRDGMQARLKTGLSCPRGPPPDAVHMSSKLVHPEPVQTTQRNHLQQQTPKMKHGRTSVDGVVVDMGGLQHELCLVQHVLFSVVEQLILGRGQYSTWLG